MGYKKPTSCSADHLAAAKFPNHGSTYTVIRHKFLIDASRSLLKTHGFDIVNEEYKATGDCNIAQGIYHIKSQKDPELGMMFAWTNSYNKQIRFQCGIGAYVFVCNNGMVAGDMSTYARKHTGNADSEAFNQIMSQIKNANKHYTKLINDKDSMKNVTMSNKEQAELVGRLFIEEELVDSSQVSCIKKEMNKPSYQYGVGQDTAWAFYNHVTHALKMSHPRSWMSDQQKFHEFMIAECLSQSTIQTTDTNNVESDPIDPNQLTIDQQIADVSETEIQLPDGRVIDELDAAEPMNEIVEVDEETFDFEM
tara:strand:- start:2523 stop:3446 length:924 start_codon:yes stop_codon:yes gene_type:complete